MVISDNHNVENITRQTLRSQKVQKPSERVTKSNPRLNEVYKDEVVFSPSAAEVKRIKELLGNLSDVRERKIASLKAEISSGTYNVKGEEVANGVIKESILNELL